jgi:subtilisin family serine protease
VFRRLAFQVLFSAQLIFSMKAFHFHAVVGLLIGFLAVCSVRAGQPHPSVEYVEGEVIVTFKSSVTDAAAGRALASHALGWRKHFDGLSRLRNKQTGLIHAQNRTTASLIAELSRNPAVETAEPNYLRRVSSAPPNDAHFNSLWALQNTGQSVAGTTGTAGDDIRFLPAWALTQTSVSNKPVVAVIDTGVDYTHPDLISNMWTNSGEIPGNGLDDDGNGYVDDFHGYDFADGLPDPTDSGHHGTHVAGTIAATGNNGLGVIGVNHQAKILMLRASNDGTYLTDAAIIEAIQYVIMMKNRGVNIVAVNESFGGGGYLTAEHDAIVAAGNLGIIFCVSAGNDASDIDTSPTYPASYHLTNMIVVAATDQNDALASFSNFGTNTVDLAAPGVNILSAMPLGQTVTIASVQQGATTYSAFELVYSGTTTGITGTVYYCGLGYPTNFPAAVSNNIALIQRGTITFSNKVANAMAAGARAVVIFNNVVGDFSNFTLGTNTIDWIPAVAISQADGLAMQTNSPATVVNWPDATQAFQYLAGTSMAAPHVSGAVAFAAMNFPSETVTQRVQRVLANAAVVPGLQPKVRGGRRLNLQRIVDTDNNSLPDWWELKYFGHLTGTSPGSDLDSDGLNNLSEWLAGTDPTNAASVLKFSQISVSNTTGAVISWPSVAGKIYRIERATNLMAGFNSIVRTNIPATAPLNTETDSVVLPGNTRYYRVGVEP